MRMRTHPDITWCVGVLTPPGSQNLSPEAGPTALVGEMISEKVDPPETGSQKRKKLLR